MPANKDNPVLVTVVLWLVLATSMVVHTALGGGLSLSTDDAMRLAQTRDLLAGQSWFDTTQWRMNTPYGLPMHWSHLVDAGIGGLILLFRLFADPKTAEIWALYSWPLLPLLLVLLAIARIGARLAGRIGGVFALLLGASCVAAIEPFRPGSIDHHNVQLALMLWTLACLVDFNCTRWAAPVAALLMCLSLAVGLETLPYIAVGMGLVAVWWIMDGGAMAAAVKRFGLTVSVMSALLLFTAVAHAYRFAASCDTFSFFYAVITVVGGLGFAGAASSSWVAATQSRRAGAIAALWFGLLLLAATAGPNCLNGPYAGIDPRIVPIWLSRIAEVQSPFVFVRVSPGNFLVTYGYAVFAVLAAALSPFAVDAGKRRSALTVALFALAGFAVTTWQVRGLSFGLFFAMPAVAALIVCGVGRLRLVEAKAAIVFLPSLAFASDATYAMAVTHLKAAGPSARDYYKAQDAWQNACLSKAALQQLDALPPGRILAFVDQGPAILANSRHSVMGGPYHRDADGILDSFAVYAGTPDAAAAIIRRRGIDDIATCAPAPDDAFYRARGGRSALLSQLESGRTIAWLAPLPPHGAVRIYRVLKDRLN